MTSSGPAPLLLFGGISPEHRVSVASAQNVALWLDQARYWFWTPWGSVLEVERSELLDFSDPFDRDFLPAAQRSWPSLDESLGHVGTSTIFLALHGGSGEDGTVQRVLEARGIPFTGSASVPSALAMDKMTAKSRVSQCGVAVPKGIVVAGGDGVSQAIHAAFLDLGPLVLKPVTGGSSIGLQFVTHESDIEAAALRIEPGSQLLAEEQICGVELTAGVLEAPDGTVRALPCSEVRLERGRPFDYGGKYRGEGAMELTPACVPADLFLAAQSLAVLCHQAIGCGGYSRTDCIAVGEKLVFLELNTLPGLSAVSFIPQQLVATGIDFRDFIYTQLMLGAQRVAIAPPIQGLSGRR